MNTRHHWDDAQIHAHVDGELDAVLSAQLEAQCRADEVLAARVATQRRLRALLGAQFDPVLAEPVPERLQQALQAQPATVTPIGAARPVRAAPHPAWWGALAASLVLGLMLGWQMPDRSALPMASGTNGPVATGALSAALSGQLSTDAGASGIAVALSFRASDGRYCRSFSLRAGADGLACRTADQWRIEVMGRAQPAGGADSYRQAASSLSPAVLAAISALQAGDTLSSDEEKQLRDAQWQESAAPGR